MNRYYIITPTSLNLGKRIEQFPPNFDFNKDYFLWLISEVIKKTSYKLESDEEDIWIPLCSKILKNHPYNYRDHLRYLCENFPNVGNVLFRQNYARNKCYSYRISPHYFSKEVELTSITDKKMLRFLRRTELLTSNNPFKKNYNFLGKYFNEKLTIDQSSACKHNKYLYAKHFDYQKHLFNAVQIAEIANKEFSIKYTNRTDGRLHHQLTRLSKEFRRFIRYNDEQLAECDLSASVPTVLCYILSNLEAGSIHLDEVVIPSKYFYRHYMFCKNLLAPTNKEIALFREAIESGEFYESFIDGMHTIHHFEPRLKPDEYYFKYVKEIFGREFDGDIEDLRTVIKTRFLSMFNAKPGHYLCEEAEFNMHYPSILRWLKGFKKVNHRYFSYLTLQMESYFMLDIVARKFNKKFNGRKPLFTLHDCLITTKSNIEVLHQFMMETLSEALGFTPVLKVEYWN